MGSDKVELEIFCKDGRNRHESHKGKKSLNYSTFLKRQFQIQKREAGREENSERDSQEQEIETEKRSKYDNGKPKRQIKQQDFYVDSDVEEENKKKPKGQRMKKRKNLWTKIH